jgi:hypothetical protein
MRLCETPWGAWIDASRIMVVEVEEENDDGWHVKVVLAGPCTNEEVWSHAHVTRGDAKACADALIVSLQPDALQSSLYRASRLNSWSSP